MHAIRVEQTGGPEVLRYAEVAQPQPGPGELLVKLGAIGVNYIDVYYRTGLYKSELPMTLGLEGAGTVSAVGSGVTEVKTGDRVAWYNSAGSYAEYVLVKEHNAVPVPSGVEDKVAAAAMLQGMTAHYLSHTTYPIQRGDSVLVHAGAGGVGLLLTQMAKQRGAHVIATVSTEAKAALAREAGADEAILYTSVDFEAEVKRITGGKGVACVYDSVGKTTFDKSINCLRPRGMMVLYGTSSGPVGPWDVGQLGPKGSLFLTRPTLFNYAVERGELLERANAVLGAIQQGTLKMRQEHFYPLKEAAQAHRDLEGRKTTGKLVLLP